MSLKRQGKGQMIIVVGSEKLSLVAVEAFLVAFTSVGFAGDRASPSTDLSSFTQRRICSFFHLAIKREAQCRSELTNAPR
jgi:hypothetical protein